jgi:hypothetical protein
MSKKQKVNKIVIHREKAEEEANKAPAIPWGQGTRVVTKKGITGWEDNKTYHR